MRTPVCIDCQSPAVPRPGKPDRCERCAQIAKDIANQKAAVMVTALRRLKDEQETAA